MKKKISKRTVSIFLVMILFIPLVSVALMVVNGSTLNSEEGNQAIDVKTSPIPEGEDIPPGVLGTPYEFEDITSECEFFFSRC